ncbi:hypothetical protein HUJ04_012257 [Dendroctonus ponderosae]|nr:hypothetical protein HUJ04_012257 [Dendroctonus ponderosae]
MSITGCSGSNAKINFREKEKEVLDQILGPGRYDARIRPSGVNGTDGPAIVRVNLFVRSITTISDNKMVSGGHPVLVDSLEVLHICYNRPLWGPCCYSFISTIA